MDRKTLFYHQRPSCAGCRRCLGMTICGTLVAVLFLLAIFPVYLSGLLQSHTTKGDVQAVRVLLALHVYPYDDAIFLAAGQGQVEMVRLLLDAGGSPNAATNAGDTALAAAAGHGHLPVVKLLLDRGANPNDGCAEATPLRCARNSGWPAQDAILKLLKQAGEKE